MAEHPNAAAIGAFLEQIKSISRPVVATQNINGKPVLNGYTASYYDDEREIGFTVIAWDNDLEEGKGLFRVIIDDVGRISDAEECGQNASRFFDGRG